MSAFVRLFSVAALAAGLVVNSSFAGEKPPPRRPAEYEPAARLQVFLDQAHFAPGKIDGRYGEFTTKALALYRESRGEPAPASPSPIGKGASPAKESGKAAPPTPPPNVSGLDLKSVQPLFINYTVTAADLRHVGTVPESIAAQAERKSLPYRSAAEAVAEKFHTDLDFLAELNPGKTADLREGDTVRVPNVEPFDLDAVKSLQPGSDLPRTPANDLDESAPPSSKENAASRKSAAADKSPEKDDAAKATPPPPITTAVFVDTKTNMLTVKEQGKLVAAYPVTVGSDELESPVGDWKVRGMEKMPTFRYDEAMLNHGERSSHFHILPPGPNNPVGVLWIALNKKGIGLHGTEDPDAIGRNASHGCVRLANWDVVRLAEKVVPGVPVSIH